MSGANCNHMSRESTCVAAGVASECSRHKLSRSAGFRRKRSEVETKTSGGDTVGAAAETLELATLKAQQSLTLSSLKVATQSALQQRTLELATPTAQQ